jgi:hypothetical protein
MVLYCETRVAGGGQIRTTIRVLARILFSTCCTNKVPSLVQSELRTLEGPVESEGVKS